jgi:hypothetical protein
MPTQITPHKTVHIEYVSLETNTIEKDQIRVNPNWYHKGERRDYILFNENHLSLACAQVVQLMNLTHARVTYPLALLRVLGTLKRNETSLFLHASSHCEYRWAPVGSFVRAVYVHAPIKEKQSYIINDLIDTDMYLRLLNV